MKIIYGFIFSKNIFDLIKYRILNSTTNIPDHGSWVVTFLLIIIFSAISLPSGLKSRFIKFEKPDISLFLKFRIGLLSFFIPSFLEELVFRALFVPHNTELASKFEIFIWGLLGLILFILYHPVNSYLFMRKARKVFINPIFLFLVTILGLFCEISYFQSGSIYTSTLIHWIVVMTWVLFLGGYRKLNN